MLQHSRHFMNTARFTFFLGTCMDAFCHTHKNATDSVSTSLIHLICLFYLPGMVFSREIVDMKYLERWQEVVVKKFFHGDHTMTFHAWLVCPWSNVTSEEKIVYVPLTQLSRLKKRAEMKFKIKVFFKKAGLCSAVSTIFWTLTNILQV